LWCTAPPAQAGDLEWYRWKDNESIPFGGFVDEMHAVRVIASEDGTDQRIIYGDRSGMIHAVRLKKERFQEEWVSHPLKSTVAEIFVADIDADGSLEIVAYCELGDIVFYKADTYKMVWRSTDDEYDSISAMVVANVDRDPQLELVFCGEAVADVSGYRPTARGSAEEIEEEREMKVSRLFVYDCLNLFVEWDSEPGLFARSIAVGDLDADGIQEIALNTGFVVDADYRRVEWRYEGGFGQKIGYADVDGDGIPELIGETLNRTRPRRLLRFFDVDLQTESFLSTGR
jgi:hypothetical protein